ncbi:MAG TPA: type VI secretion system-associated FHA domain protein TagH [Vicinamibacterales bacterium]|nr:type VI secretion system-associated FHA domain protein TagH [Vicinamibacterales bacterium]
MTLTLELTTASGARAGDVSQRVFGEDGGTIGRAPNNSWVLTHNKVSGRHANITFRNGVFYIEDVSRNGISVNSPDNRLVHNRPYALKTGDRIFIEPYEIGVWIDGDAARSGREPIVDPFADLDPFAGPANAASSPVLPETPGNEVVDPLLLIEGGAPPPKRSAPPPPPADNFLGQHYQPPVVLSPPPAPRPSPAGRPNAPSIPAGYNPLAPDDSSDRMTPPRPVPAARPVAPPAYNPLAVDDPFATAPAQPPPGVHPTAPVPIAPTPSPPPAAGSVASPPLPVDEPIETPPSVVPIRPRPGVDATPARRRSKESSTSDSQAGRLPDPAPVVVTPPVVAQKAEPASPPGVSIDLGALLAGAGVPNGVLTPELSRSLGEILRVVVIGLMDVLQSRQRIKEEFGMQQTIFRPADNNPLKFSANVEDALHNLFVRRNPAYLGSVDAFSDAFDDLRDHQLAVLAGMRVAFEAMLAEFDPDRLQQQFDKQMGGGLALMPAKMRYWELFRARRVEMAKDPEDTFERLFGEEFRRAYEEQFRQLKSQRRQRKDGQGPPPASS